jgi:hypothetical protein
MEIEPIEMRATRLELLQGWPAPDEAILHATLRQTRA